MKPKPTIEQRLRTVEKAVRRLQPEQGPRARRNARRALTAAVRALTSSAAESFPYPSRKRKQVSMTPQARAMRLRKRETQLRKRGYEPANSTTMTRAVEIGVRATKLGDTLWLPWWLRLSANLADLQRMKHDKAFRNRLYAKREIEKMHKEDGDDLKWLSFKPGQTVTARILPPKGQAGAMKTVRAPYFR